LSYIKNNKHTYFPLATLHFQKLGKQVPEIAIPISEHFQTKTNKHKHFREPRWFFHSQLSPVRRKKRLPGGWPWENPWTPAIRRTAHSLILKDFDEISNSRSFSLHQQKPPIIGMK
jgi:hypothetical protein